jgi:asparagine synthase (glutamine-hydrolysing)
MLRYIAFVWDPEESLAADRAAQLLARFREQRGDWKSAIDTLGLAVFYMRGSSTDRVQVFPVGCGVAFGSLFYRPDPEHDDLAPAQTTLSAIEAERIIATDARGLISRYWGDYVVLFREWDGGAVRVVRGPSSTLRCLQVKASTVHVYCSDIEAYAGLLEQPLAIDWRAVSRTFLGPEAPHSTHLKEVRELPPGHCDRVSGTRASSAILWDPERLSLASQIDDPREAARILRNVTRACVHARASEFSSIVMSISGGLDSSITLSCLADAPSRPRVLCLTQYAQGTDSDERFYARLAAQAAGCRLIEHARDSVPDMREAAYTQLLDMSPGLRMPQIDLIDANVAQAHRAQAIFDGNGGDEIFCRVHHWLHVSDYIRAKGFGGDFLPLLMNAAFTGGVTVWSVLGRALFHALRPGRLNLAALVAKDIHGSTLLRPELIDELIAESRRHTGTYPTGIYDVHSHGRRPRVPPGRAWQCALITARRSVPSPFARPDDPVRVSPLLSQPLLETCLRIPTWFESSNRRDRSLARDAFAKDVPREIITRHDKGGAETVASELIRRNLPFLREMLLDGLVSHSGIVDTVRLEAALSPSPSSDGVSSVPVFDLLGAELWARAWLSHAGSSSQNLLRSERLYEDSSPRL